MQGETKTSNDCQICLEKCKHKKIQCGFCDFNGCKDCVKESILFSMVDPCCPKCKHNSLYLEFCFFQSRKVILFYVFYIHLS